MRIGVVTLPLHYNYGGILQNWALQQVLIGLGHQPITIDAYVRYPYSHYCVKKCINSLLKALGRRSETLVKPYKGRATKQLLGEFITSRIQLTAPVNKYDAHLINKYKLDAIVVGSDQIWRPKYNERIETVYLDFLRDKDIKRIGFSVSLGSDFWEYSENETLNCSELIKAFSGVSVREKSGVELLAKHLNYYPELTIDPTLFLTAGDYAKLCQNIPATSDPFIFVYCLDSSEAFIRDCNGIGEKIKMPIRFFGADDNCSLSVPQWIAMFRDACGVITDSYHGTIFSLLFGKPVKIYINEDRGKSRLETLLSYFDCIEDDHGFKKFDTNSQSFNMMKKRSVGYLQAQLSE